MGHRKSESICNTMNRETNFGLIKLWHWTTFGACAPGIASIVDFLASPLDHVSTLLCKSLKSIYNTNNIIFYVYIAAQLRCRYLRWAFNKQSTWIRLFNKKTEIMTTMTTPMHMNKGQPNNVFDSINFLFIFTAHLKAHNLQSVWFNYNVVVVFYLAPLMFFFSLGILK